MRRFSGLGAVVFAVVFLVGVARAHALALVAGDDELCFAMGFAGRTAAPATDPADLAAGHHACCDLALCLDASALPPGEPPVTVAPRMVRRSDRPRPRVVAARRRRGEGHRPRAPPAT